jgi:hypothetical protein
MIIDNDPPLERHISVPRDMSQLSCSSFTAGIVEAVLDGLGFVRFLLPVAENDLLTKMLTACPSDCTQHSDRPVSVTNDNTDKARQVRT